MGRNWKILREDNQLPVLRFWLDVELAGPPLLANRISKERPSLYWGLDYGSTPIDGAIMLNDSIPRPAAKFGEFRIVGDEPDARGKPPASISLGAA